MKDPKKSRKRPSRRNELCWLFPLEELIGPRYICSIRHSDCMPTLTPEEQKRLLEAFAAAWQMHKAANEPEDGRSGTKK